MSIRSSQTKSSYLTKITPASGLSSSKDENNNEILTVNVGYGLKIIDDKLVIDPENDINLSYNFPLYCTYYSYVENDTLVIEYNKLQIYGGDVYYNTLQTINVSTSILEVSQTEANELDIQREGTSYIYFRISDQLIYVQTSNILDSNNDYVPIAKVITGYSESKAKYIVINITDRRPLLAWNTYASPDYLPSSKIGEIVRFKADYDPGPNFIKADGRTIPDAYPSLQKIYGSTVPIIPSANGTDFYVRARLESGFVISPDSYWSTELYHLANLDLMIEAYYYTTTDVKLSDNELNDLYTNGFPIINKASSSVTQPYKYILTFPQAINNGQLSVHNAETHDIKWNVDGDKVYIVASDAQTSIGEFDFYGSMSNVAMALNKWDTYATEDLTPESDTTVLSIPFLLYNKNVDVYKNGQLLKSSEWSVTSNNSIQLVIPANGTDWFRVVSTAKLPTHAHQHMPNYESEWVSASGGSDITFTHNLNLADPLKATYVPLRKTNTNNIYQFHPNISIKDPGQNSLSIIISSSDTEITHVKLVILANQYNNNALPWYGESGSTIDLEEKALITEANITAKQLISTETTTSPIDVQSTVKVTNLNSDLLDDLHADTANTASTIVARDASGNFSSNVVNLNAVKIDSVTTVDKNSNGEIRTTTNELIATKSLVFGVEDESGNWITNVTPVLRQRDTTNTEYYYLVINTKIIASNYSGGSNTMFDVIIKTYCLGANSNYFHNQPMQVRITGYLYNAYSLLVFKAYITNSPRKNIYVGAYVGTDGYLRLFLYSPNADLSSYYRFTEVYFNNYYQAQKSSIDDWSITYANSLSGYDTSWGMQYAKTEGDVYSEGSAFTLATASLSGAKDYTRYFVLTKPCLVYATISTTTNLSGCGFFDNEDKYLGNYIDSLFSGYIYFLSHHLPPGKYYIRAKYTATTSLTLILYAVKVNEFAPYSKWSASDICPGGFTTS